MYIHNALYGDEKVGVKGCIMHNALYCNEKVGVRGCIMHNGGIPDRVIADTIDILPLLTALSGNTIRSNLLKCKKAKKNILCKIFHNSLHSVLHYKL